jgi:type I site-specific restriction endonuclease
MAALEENLKRINNKLQLLLKQFMLLQKENEKLKETIKIIQLTKDNDTEQIGKLQQQVSILKTSIGQMTEPEKKAFEKQINQYIKEVDKCIGLLSE